MKPIGCSQVRLLYFSASNPSNIKKCIFCNQENHKFYHCKIVSKPEVRKGIILFKRLCYVRLKASPGTYLGQITSEKRVDGQNREPPNMDKNILKSRNNW